MLRIIIILGIGAGIGALTGHFGKCTDGQCPLTANPLRGALWGLFLAFVFAYPMIISAFRKPVPESENIRHTGSAEEFRSLITKEGQVCLVDFYADWCGPCRGLAPVINRLADEFKGKAAVVKVNIDKFPALAEQYGIKPIPSVIILAGGEEKERVTGAGSFGTYAELLNRYTEK
jgi:thioredoxin 1